MTLKLTVVDQSPVQGEPNHISPVAITIDLAKHCDQLGYHRYWLAEHHNSINFSGPCPEILIGHLASVTKKIRIGSGGVMLSHYSPYKVAEQFSLLETLYPGRIDLGIGRAPGGDALASHALAYPAQPDLGNYAEQAWLLSGFIKDNLPKSHPYKKLKIFQDQSKHPQIWMLGSSGASAGLAGQLGMKMSLALFISPNIAPPSVITEYEKAWFAADHDSAPEVNIAVAALCAETKEQAEYLVAPSVYWKIKAFKHGVREFLKKPEEVLDLKNKLNTSDKAFFDVVMNSIVLGTPEECAEKLHKLAKIYSTKEVGIVTVTYDYKDRLNSYRELANMIIG